MRAYSADRMRERERASQFHERKKRPDIMFVRNGQAPAIGPRRSPRATRRCSTRSPAGSLERLGYDA